MKDVLKNPALFADVFEGMLHNEPVVRMRSADVLEKVSSKHSIAKIVPNEDPTSYFEGRYKSTI